jgi:hypothetical protein
MVSSNKRLTKEKEEKTEGIRKRTHRGMAYPMNCGIRREGCCLGGKEQLGDTETTIVSL